MTNIRAGLVLLAAGSAAAFALPGAVAAGAQAPGPSLHAAPRPAAAQASAAWSRATPDARLRVIFSNLGRDPVLPYDCCFAWGLTGPAAETGDATAVGVSFRPIRSARVRQLELGLSYLSGTNQVFVVMHEDAGGVPGRVMAEFTVVDVPRIGSCCELAQVTPEGVPVPVQAGRLYWVTARVDGNTLAGWNVALPVMFGPLSLDRGAGWAPNLGVQPSLRVFGQ